MRIWRAGSAYQVAATVEEVSTIALGAEDLAALDTGDD
jgi:hypothetical protein